MITIKLYKNGVPMLEKDVRLGLNTPDYIHHYGEVYRYSYPFGSALIYTFVGDIMEL